MGELARGVSEGLISESDGASILVVLAEAGDESTSKLAGDAVRILAEQPDLQQELSVNSRLMTYRNSAGSDAGNPQLLWPIPARSAVSS